MDELSLGFGHFSGTSPLTQSCNKLGANLNSGITAQEETRGQEGPERILLAALDIVAGPYLLLFLLCDQLAGSRISTGGGVNHSHCRAGETEDQRSLSTCPKSHRQDRAEPRLKSRFAELRSHPLPVTAGSLHPKNVNASWIRVCLAQSGDPGWSVGATERPFVLALSC